MINTADISALCKKKRACRIKRAQFHASLAMHFVDLSRTLWRKDEVNRRAGVQPRFYLGPILLHELNYFSSLALPNSYWPHLLWTATITAPYCHLLMKQQYSKQVGLHTCMFRVIIAILPILWKL